MVIQYRLWCLQVYGSKEIAVDGPLHHAQDARSSVWCWVRLLQCSCHTLTSTEDRPSVNKSHIFTFLLQLNTLIFTLLLGHDLHSGGHIKHVQELKFFLKFLLIFLLVLTGLVCSKQVCSKSTNKMGLMYVCLLCNYISP